MITCSSCKKHIIEETKYTNWLTLFNFITFLKSEGYIELETRDEMINCLMTLKQYAFSENGEPIE